MTKITRWIICDRRETVESVAELFANGVLPNRAYLRRDAARRDKYDTEKVFKVNDAEKVFKVVIAVSEDKE